MGVSDMFFSSLVRGKGGRVGAAGGPNFIDRLGGGAGAIRGGGGGSAGGGDLKTFFRAQTSHEGGLML